MIIWIIIIGWEPREVTGRTPPRARLIDATDVGQSVPFFVNF